MINKKYILVDGENISASEYNGLDKLTSKDTVVIFNSIFGEGRLNWKLLYEIQQRPKNERPDIIFSNVKRKAKSNEKDKMDYYMIAHLTECLTKDNSFLSKLKTFFNKSEIEYCIISKDKGFDKYISYFKDIYGKDVHRFNNFNDLNMYYKKSTNKKTNTLNTKVTPLTNNSTDNSVDTNKLSQEVKTLTKLVKDLISKIEDNNSNYLYNDATTNDINIKNADISLSSKNTSNLTIDTLISKEKITGGNSITFYEKDSDILDTSNSNVVYLYDFKNIESNDFSKNTDICSDIYKVEDNITTVKTIKKFDKINLKKFNDNYSSYPKKTKLLRDGDFVKNIFIKHGLYKRYNNKSLDKFVRDCDKGIINIRTMTIRIVASFSPNSINDFRPALNEIIKYQIKNNIM